MLTVGRSSEDTVASLGVSGDAIVATHNSIDVDTLEVGLATVALTPVPPGRFAYVGQLIERKNVESILLAMSLADGVSTLDIVGEGPLKSELRAAVERMGLTDHVQFVGYLEPQELGRKLATVATVILPSTEEVYGMAPVEALALGRQVIVSSRAGVARDLKGMKGVWVVEPTTAELGQAMKSASVAWQGPIARPAVRGWTAEKFADDVMRAVDIAGRRRGRAELR